MSNFNNVPNGSHVDLTKGYSPAVSQAPIAPMAPPSPGAGHQPTPINDVPGAGSPPVEP